MNVVGTPQGLVLIFESKKELKGIIKQLSNMVEWIESDDNPPPYLYSMSDDRIAKEEIEIILTKIKKGLAS